jgi:integrase
LEAGTQGEIGLKTKLTTSVIKNLKVKERRYSVSDTEVMGLLVRVEPSGSKNYYADYRNPRTGRRISRRLGYTHELTVTQARELVMSIRADVRNTGVDPTAVERELRERLTLKELIDLYIEWLTKHRRGLRQNKTMLRSFASLYSMIAEEITPAHITAWTNGFAHLSPNTVNRRIAILKGMYSWAVKMGHLKFNVLKGNIEMLKNDEEDEDSNDNVRYLTPNERTRLLQALEDRDAEEKDYLRCAVLLSLNTGIRKGTLLRLRWRYVNWQLRSMKLPASIMKGKKTKTIPLNTIAIEALANWKQRSAPKKTSSYIFPGDTPKGHLGDTKNPWKLLLRRAGITNFRWHDMRHDFASQLAMQGVDILTIKDLMCHENLNMTMVYAHLSPGHIAAATEGLTTLYNSTKP